MPTSSTSAFSDPYEFASALRRHGIVRLIPTQDLGFRAQLTDIRLSHLALLAARESVSRVATMSASAGQTLIVFAMTKGGAQYLMERRLSFNKLAVISGPTQVSWRICAPVRWGAILLPAQLLIAYLRTIVGEQTQPPPLGLTIWCPRLAPFRELLALHRGVVRCTVRQPETLIDTEAIRALEQQLLASLVEVLCVIESD